MSIGIGILFAFGALIFWGFGDFLIQKSARKFGDWETLFVIVAFGTIILIPFVYKDFVFLLQQQSLIVLIIASVVITVAAILNFQALKEGKISVVEPIFVVEILVTALLAFSLIGESVQLLETALISILVVGLIMVSLRSHHFEKKTWIEKGAILAVVGSFFMGLSNFSIGFASRITNPLLVIWFTNLFMTLICITYLSKANRLRKMIHDFRLNTKLILSVSTLDNLAWISFAFAATFAPIVIAVALSESYIALAALLGLLINREHLFVHQKAGLVISLSSAITLAAIIA